MLPCIAVPVSAALRIVSVCYHWVACCSVYLLPLYARVLVQHAASFRDLQHKKRLQLSCVSEGIAHLLRLQFACAVVVFIGSRQPSRAYCVCGSIHIIPQDTPSRKGTTCSAWGSLQASNQQQSNKSLTVLTVLTGSAVSVSFPLLAYPIWKGCKLVRHSPTISGLSGLWYSAKKLRSTAKKMRYVVPILFCLRRIFRLVETTPDSLNRYGFSSPQKSGYLPVF